MALFETPPTASEKAETLPSPVETATVYQAATTVPSRTSLDGSPWPITYYSQLLGSDDAPRQLDLTLDPSLQCYTRINKFIIMASNELEASTDAETGISTVSGNGQIYPGVVPNVGDHFVGAMPDGVVGLFIIKSLSRISFYSYSAYDITYELFDFHATKYQNNLTAKTVETLTFDASNAGCPGAVGTDDGKAEANGYTLARLVNQFYDQFYDLESRTALMPVEGQSGRYDASLAKFFTSIVGRDLRQHHPMLTVYETPTGRYEKKLRTVLDVMLDGEDYGLDYITKTVGEASTATFQSGYVFNTIHTTSINMVRVPANEDTLNGGIVHEIEPYVFTEAFYDRTTVDMSLTEKYVSDALEGKQVTLDKVGVEVNALHTKTPKERFYLIPVYIWLLQYITRSDSL